MIREMQAHDFSAVMRLNNDNVPAVSLIDLDELRKDVRLAEHALVITDTATSAPHGFCTTFASGISEDLGVNYAWFADRYPAFVYLDRVVIDTPFQSQGRGELLYTEVERRIRATGTTDLFVCEVNLQPRNEGSLRFHARLGFEQVGEQESKPGLIVAMLAKRLV
jgi:predicted GNAT superfamily acetyltransferase